MSIFNKDFYPTPREVIDQMIFGLDLFDKVVLEPSSGKGDILDVLNDIGATTVACEFSEELSTISKTKCDNFLKNDFFKVTREEVSHLDFIIMNPPFSNGDKHILHAWEIAPDGCEIIALCNYETLHNTYSMRRTQLTNTISSYGNYENLGCVFGSAERETDVEIGLVRLFKPNANNDWEGFFDTEDEPDYTNEGIMPYNAIRDVVGRYIQAVDLYDNVLELGVKMNDLINPFGGDKLTFTISDNEAPKSKERFKIDLRKRCWNWVFLKLDMSRFMTESLKEELNKFSEKQSNVPFTVSNIRKMIDMVIQTHGQRMERVYVEVFDKLTSRYHKNRYSIEGWKTNSHYMVNKKFILEGVVNFEWGKLRGNYGSYNTRLLDDFVKALDYLTGGTAHRETGGFYHWANNVEMEPNSWVDMGYFEIKAFKKGTIHAKFKDDNVWATFNRAVAQVKGYELPENI